MNMDFVFRERLAGVCEANLRAALEQLRQRERPPLGGTVEPLR